MVAFNIDRMVNAFTGKGDMSELVLENADDDPAESAAALLLAERARVARTRSDHVFFERHKQSAQTSFAFAREYAKFLKENKKYEEALEVIGDRQSTEIIVLRAEIMLAMNKLDIAEEAIRPLCHAGVPGQAHWQILLKIAEARKSVREIFNVEEAWLRCQPRRRSQILLLTGRALRLRKKNKAALERLVEVAADPDRSDLAAIECATAMFDVRKYEEAARVLQDVGGQTDWQVRQISRLNRKIESRLRGMAAQNPVDAEN
jgi:predicted Zn-dependent protease